MSQFFQIRTIFLFGGLISACLFVCMLYIYKNRKTYPGFKQWTIAFMFNFSGGVLLSCRDFLPFFTTVILANLLVVLLFVFIARGLITFVGNRQNNLTDISILSLYIAAYIYFSYFSPNINARIIIISSVLILFCIRCIFICHRKLPLILTRSNCLLMTAFILIALSSLFRVILMIVFNEHISDFMSAGTIHGVSMILVTTGHIFIAIGLIVINAQRLEQELINAKAEIKTLIGFIPICANCKNIRDDQGYWQQIEAYIKDHSEAEFTHSICPDCLKLLYPDYDFTD